MSRRIVECIPNFSEGRDTAKVDRIAAAIVQERDTAILGMTMDADHNRSVITFAGPPSAVAEAAIRAVATASDTIDLNHHAGVHPRIGATDVLPFVPIEGVTMDECVALAVSVGEKIWSSLGVPVYLYEEAARFPERKRLENIRRGQFEGLRQIALQDVSRQPDIGGPELHPTAGATVVGARRFLIAYNINLATPDTSVARSIAKSVRASSGGYPHVKALGLPLSSRGQSQVSMNLTDFERTPLHVVYDAVREQADREGITIAGSEIIGLIPKAALEAAAEYFLRCENFSPELVLENRLAQVLPYSIEEIFDEISDPGQELLPGETAALLASFGAALGVLTARRMNLDSSGLEEHRRFFKYLLTPDALTVGERTHALRQQLRALIDECPRQHGPVAAMAHGLVDAALQGAVAALELELAQVEDPTRRLEIAEKLRQLK